MDNGTPSMKFYTWDLETYPNCFLFAGKFEGEACRVFEISDRKNERDALLSWINYLGQCGAVLVGYNSLGFDYPILHELITNPYTFDANKAYLMAQQIIGNQEYGFETIRMSDRHLPQVDLAKVNHFDNKARRTSLKSLQFAMRASSVEDLPIPPGTRLDSEQIEQLRSYNVHDVEETERFLQFCKPAIFFRKELLDNGTISGDVLNYSDVKIGSEYLVNKIGRAKCYYSPGKPKQTHREVVEFKDVILPKIWFRTEPFQAVLDWFKAQKVFLHKDAERPTLECTLAKCVFAFGIGGVHASVENKSYRADDRTRIVDIDVSGMYPAIAIANGFAPEHLGKSFVDAYKQLQIDRRRYPKGTPMNALLKLAGNGVFGNSDNVFSPFYDPKYPREITINGQLQILQLVERLALIPGVEIIQANTDGITLLLPRANEAFFEMWKTDWEQETGLVLEQAEYSAMWIRDVNNYVAVTTGGKVKRKGAYAYPGDWKDYDGFWNKDYSAMIVQKAAEQMLVEGANPADLVRIAADPFDFMIRYKTPAGATVFIGEKPMQKTVRYYVSTHGQPMKKVAAPKGEIGEFKRKNGLKDAEFKAIAKTIPPGTWDERIHTKNKSKYETVTTGIEAGRLVKECNVAKDFDWADVDFDYYVKEIEKLRIES